MVSRFENHYYLLAPFGNEGAKYNHRIIEVHSFEPLSLLPKCLIRAGPLFSNDNIYVKEALILEGLGCCKAKGRRNKIVVTFWENQKMISVSSMLMVLQKATLV